MTSYMKRPLLCELHLVVLCNRGNIGSILDIQGYSDYDSTLSTIITLNGDQGTLNKLD